MKILVLHRIPYHKIQYHRGIDHVKHDVTYIGPVGALANIPSRLRCRKIARPGLRAASEEIIEMLRGEESLQSDQYHFDRVISLSEYELIEAAKIREAFKIQGPTLLETMLVRDKVLMKEAVARAGIRVPQFLTVNALVLDKDVKTWSGATVLKPNDGASSENVKIYPSLSQCRDEILQNKTEIVELKHNRFQVEEYIEGPILHIDGLVSDGIIQCWLPSKYLGTCLDYANGHALGSLQIPPTVELESFTTSVLKALQIKEGSFHLEAIQSSEGLLFLEIANRVGGADVVETFERATGVFLPAAELSSLVGDQHLYDISSVLNYKNSSYGWFVFPGHCLPEGYARICGLEKYRTDSHFLKLNELIDSPLPRTITYQSVEVPLAGIVSSLSAEELELWMRQFLSSIKITSVPQLKNAEVMANEARHNTKH